MKIVIDRNIPGIDKTFARHGDIERVDGRSLDRRQLINADALITRSISRVDAGLLEGTRVRFVGTATIGEEHVDKEYLASAGIGYIVNHLAVQNLLGRIARNYARLADDTPCVRHSKFAFGIALLQILIIDEVWQIRIH